MLLEVKNVPRGNGTGPIGMGPLTGRGAGFCAGFKIPGFVNLNFGRGMGLGRGRGFRRMSWLARLLPGCGYLAYRWANRNRIPK
ncbi:DUF5320 domain-containing protein [Pelotomaculum sp. PtaB.Bin117]|uniref:DUF5320 domain-containing protein n=1 Tax=Pelotomaculum sp. PtaB.Bin117 TaxID=1811694 RepID=UPI0009C9DE9B|nr:MAG: hypothetical protein A4E56_01651 [Pelotomaculum sp. PtaU1.Bin065]